MNQKRVFLLCGIPASGKSTWARAQQSETTKWISRDVIRFNILQEGDDYFAKEDEVFDIFINLINDYLKDDIFKNIIIDATHLNKKSRDKVLKKLDKTHISECNCIVFTTPLEICLDRNEQRSGREKVPRGVIRRMFFSCEIPKAEENFNHVYSADGFGNIKEVKRVYE